MASKRFIDMTVDSDSLSHRKKVWNNTTGTGTPATYLKYIYDGWNLIAELNGKSSNAVVRTYSWGPEAQGAPGTLRMIADNNGVYFPAYDPNGNVMGLVKASDGTVCAQYEYLPYGELAMATGTMAVSNPIRFSTKYRDNETDLYYYGYRYYSPNMGRWLSRDPIEEQGGLNLYGFVNNDPVNKWDLWGMKWEIDRDNLKEYAFAQATDPKDTFDDLARQLRLDTIDYQEWAHTSDSIPNLCKKYQIPNTIFVDFGQYEGILYKAFWSIFPLWEKEIAVDIKNWRSNGFHVKEKHHVSQEDVQHHLEDDMIHGYVYIGHGGRKNDSNLGGSIVTKNPGPERDEGLAAGRYTKYGIAFMRLQSCYSAKLPNLDGEKFDHILWRENVASRGTFIGYIGAVCSLSRKSMEFESIGLGEKYKKALSKKKLHKCK